MSTKIFFEPFDRGTNLLTATNALPDIPVSRRLDGQIMKPYGKTDNIDFKIEHKLSDGWKKCGVIAMRVTNISTIKLASLILTLKLVQLRRAIEQQQGDQRVHSGTLNIVGEFGIGDIANRFVAGVDVMRNIRDIGPIYNQGITKSDINIDNPVYTNPVAEHKTVTATLTNITISKPLVFIFKIPLTLQITLS